MTMTPITGAAAAALAFALAACSGGSGQPRAATPVAPPSATVTPDAVIYSPTPPSVSQVRQWPTAWCKAKPGMTRAQLRALMGAPTGDLSVASGVPQMSWEFAEYHFDAFMNVNDKVRQLDINDVQLSPAERAAIHCATTRR